MGHAALGSDHEEARVWDGTRIMVMMREPFPFAFLALVLAVLFLRGKLRGPRRTTSFSITGGTNGGVGVSSSSSALSLSSAAHHYLSAEAGGAGEVTREVE